jgi:hypothetical protein
VCDTLELVVVELIIAVVIIIAVYFGGRKIEVDRWWWLCLEIVLEPEV